MNWSYQIFFLLLFILVYGLIFVKYYRYLRISYDFSRKIYIKFFLRFLILFLFYQSIFIFKSEKSFDIIQNNEVLFFELTNEQIQNPEIETKIISQIKSLPDYAQIKLITTSNEISYSLSPLLNKKEMINLMEPNRIKNLPLIQSSFIQFSNYKVIRLNDFSNVNSSNSSELSKSINLSDLNNESFKYYLLILLTILVYIDFQINFKIIKN
ncbi:MAG: hypothetical protein RIR51_1079 [Bacteroidota bacterium]